MAVMVDPTGALTRAELHYLLGCLEVHVGDLRDRTPEQRRAITPDPQPYAEALLAKVRAMCQRDSP